MNITDWQRRSALFDEVVDLPVEAREEWLAALAKNAPQHLAAVTKMLLDYDQTEPDRTAAPMIGGLGTVEFESRLDCATMPADMQLKSGALIGAWRLDRKIGEGGMGSVWLAARQDGHFKGSAAIKFLRTGSGNTEVVERFLRERRLLARLIHPGIARLLDAGTHAGEPYLVMEYIDGQPITAWAAAHAPRVADRISLMLKVCRAAEYAHSQLIVHRDLKPSNVLVNRMGEPSLLDFGIAKLIDAADDDYATALTRITGRGFTLGYCAPEQITGEPTGVAADVFSMGVLLFELLTGTLPFRPQQEGRAALEHAMVHADARSISKALDEAAVLPGNLPSNRPVDAERTKGDLEAIVARALRKKPADRYPTLSAFADDLERWLNNLPVAARRGNWQYMTLLWLKRNRALAVVGTAAFIAVSTGMVTAIWQAERASEEALRADQEKEVAVEQRRRAEIATAQATAALAESDQAKRSALQAGQLAERSASLARQSEQTAMQNELRSRQAEADAATSSRNAQKEAAKAKAVNQYLVTLFESADPERIKGEKLTARELLDSGAKSLTTQFANDPQTLAELQAVLGRTYVGLSQPKTAIPLLTEAAATVATKYGDRSVEHARILYSLARAESEIDNFPEAQKHYQIALDILEPLDGIASETIVTGKTYLAHALQKQGKFAEIDSLLAPVRAAIIAQLGDQSWLFVEIENARAVALSGQGKINEEHRILLSIEPLLKAPPPGKRADALVIRNNLAIAFARIGNLAEAIPRANAAVAGFIEHLGPDAEQTLKTMWFSGELLRQAGRYADCATQYERVAEIRARVTGETHPLTVDVFSKTASCAQLTGNEAQAAAYTARALAALAPTDQPPQRNVLRTLLTLQLYMLDRADTPRARTLLLRTKALAVALNLSATSPESLWITVVEACTAARAGDVKAALRGMDALLVKAPMFTNLPAVRSLYAYFLVLDGQFEHAQAEMIEARKLAALRMTETHPVYLTFNYVDALIARPKEGASALRALETGAGRAARLPLAPNWFGL